VASAVPAVVFTPLRREIVRALANLNDQYCAFLFLEFQFFEQLKGLGPTVAGLYTSQVFHRNPFGPRIHVPVDMLQPFLERNRGVSFGAYLSTSYEVASTFVDKALALLQETNPTSLKLPKRQTDGPEQYYWRALQSSGYSLPEKELSDTLAFIRYRRNAIVHLSATPKLAYQEFVKLSGPGLNNFWKKAKVQVEFANPSVGSPSEQDTLDLLKLLRIVTQRLDAHLATLIDVPGLINLEAKRILGNKATRFNLLVRERRVRKLRFLLRREYGLAAPESTLTKAVRLAGTI
jgi:hypothetical protein